MKSILILMALLCSKYSFAIDSSNISTTRYVTGGILSIYPGFGIGHAVQGRWAEKGWIFTTGESISATIAVIGLGECGISSGISSGRDCSGKDKILVGTVGFIGFKIWEIVDAWILSKAMNNSLNRSSGTRFLVMPMPNQTGVSVGLNYSFR